MRTEHRVTAGGVRARVIEEGSGEPVLLVHGVGAFAENWDPILAGLAANGYRAIACDLPGHGESERARGVRYFDPQAPYYVRFLTDVLDACGVDRADFVGHSLGGGIAGVMALAAPHRVKRLVLVAPGGLGENLTRPLRLSALPFAYIAARFLSDDDVRAYVRSCFYDTARVPEWLDQLAIRYARAGAAAEFARVMRQVATLFGLRPSLRRAWLGRLAELRCPALVVWGREDAVLPLADAEATLRTLPHARLVVIPSAGHLVMLEQPEEFLRAILAFFRST